MSKQNHWKTDKPSTIEEALQLLRFGCVMRPEFTHDTQDDWIDQVRTEKRMFACAELIEKHILAQQRTAAPAASAWRTVPVEPTPEMIQAGYPPNSEEAQDWDCAAVYRAMLSVAPKPTEQEGWQPIETAPKDGTVILVYFPRHGWLAVSWDESYGLWCVGIGHLAPYPVRGYTDDQLTVWMPLPTQPTDSGREKG